MISTLLSWLFILFVIAVIVLAVTRSRHKPPSTQPQPQKPAQQLATPPEPDPPYSEGDISGGHVLIGVRTARMNPLYEQDPRMYREFEKYTRMTPVEYNLASQDMWQVSICDDVRNRAVYIIGKTGTGKSSLAETMAIQDIRREKGVAFIDPHGKHAKHLLDYVPSTRVNDVIYFEPKEYPLPIDLLDAGDDDEANELASDVIAMFKRLTQDFGQQMDTILKFAVHTLVRARRHMPVTFMDLERLLIDEDYLKKCLKFVDHEAILHFWNEEYPAFKRKDSTLAIIRRMTDFRLSSVLPFIFGEEGRKSIRKNLDVREIMDEHKILIVNLGNVLPDDARIIGTFLVTKIQLVLPRRQNLIPFYLYVDELDEFAASPFQKIITKCRKFEICLTLLNQAFYQIRDEQNRKAIKGIDTKVIFRVDSDDANYLKTDIAPFDSQLATTLRGDASITTQ